MRVTDRQTDGQNNDS